MLALWACAQPHCRGYQQACALQRNAAIATRHMAPCTKLPPAATCASQRPPHATCLQTNSCCHLHLYLHLHTSSGLTPEPLLRHRNKGGYETSETFKAKFTHVSPVWYQLKYKDEQFVIQGGHDVNTTWVRELQKPYADVSVLHGHGIPAHACQEQRLACTLTSQHAGRALLPQHVLSAPAMCRTCMCQTCMCRTCMCRTCMCRTCMCRTCMCRTCMCQTCATTVHQSRALCRAMHSERSVQGHAHIEA
jgi:hypothetical protein